MRRIAAGALLGMFVLQSFCASLRKSPAFDEPAHIAAGVSYLATGVFRANLQHPPLLKEIAATFAMAGAGVRWPDTEAARALVANPAGASGREWTVGNGLIARGGPDRVLFWARLPMILIAALLGLAIYLWARQMLGEAAALGALLLFAFDPVILAHSYLVTTDVGLAAFTVLFFMGLWNYCKRPAARYILWCGMALGAALASKYSAVLLAPVALALLVAARGRRGVGPFLAICAVAFGVVEAAFLLHSPALYLEGIRRVNADHDPNYLAFFAGEFGRHFYGYFAGAYLLKEPLAAVAAGVIGLVVQARGLRAKRGDRLRLLFLLLPPAVLFLACSIAADELGVRYLIPALPFAFLLGGSGLAWLWRRAACGRAAAVLLCAWLVAQAAAIYPDHLSYFNESACLFYDPARLGPDGGSRCGPAWLDDSNVDWGQGVKQLRSWLDAHGVRGPIRFAYFGSFPPQNYGIDYTTPDPRAEPSPGVYAVSAHYLPRLVSAGAWFGEREPAAVVGHAIYVYVVP